MMRARFPFLKWQNSFILLILILLTTSLGLSCASRSRNWHAAKTESAPGYAMDEGMVAGDVEFEMAPMEAPNMQARNAPDPTSSVTTSSGAELAAGQSAAGPGPSFNFDDWLVPKAYAAEAIPDTRYLIRNGNLSLNVESFDKTAAEVSTVAEKHQGIITDSTMEKYGDGSRTGWIKVRVPADEFFAAWEELKTLGDVKNQHISSQDVSTQYISTVSRLKVLHTEQETLRNMLEEALDVQRKRGLGEAYSVLLQTQQRLSEVSYEIQNYEDSLAQLADQITNSTITVNLTEQAAYVADEWNWGYNETTADAQKDLRIKWRGFVQGVIYFFVSGWTSLIPWVILLVIALIVYRSIMAKRRKHAAIRQVRHGPAQDSNDNE